MTAVRITASTPAGSGALELAREVLEIEAAAVTGLIARLDQNFQHAVDIILSSHGRVTVSGMGKSGHIARKIASTMSSTGTPAYFVHPAEASHGDLGMITRDDVFIALSNSGESAELLAIVPLIKRQGAKLIALTGNPGFSLVSITPVGLPVALVGVAFMLWWYPRALPNYRNDPLIDRMREFTLEVAVARNGPLVGKSVQQAGLRNLKRIYLVEIEREGHILTAVTPDEILKGGDRLVFAGDTEAISDLLRINGLVPSTHEGEPLLNNHQSERRLVEAVISPHSDCIGETIRESNFRSRYGAVVLAVARNGERVVGNLGSIQLQAGDTLLLEARPAFVTRQRYNKDFLLINDLDSEPPRHQRAYLAWGILLGIITLATFELTSMLNAALLGAAAMLIVGCCSVGQAQKSLDIEVLVTIAASFALGAALKSTGVAAVIAEQVVSLSGGEAVMILILTYLTVNILTEILSNNAAAVLMLPIVLDMTESAHLNPEPFIFAIMVAASAGFSTPIGYQTNLMVQGPGNYRFSDFVKVGVPMNIVIAITAITAIWLIYPLRA